MDIRTQSSDSNDKMEAGTQAKKGAKRRRSSSSSGSDHSPERSTGASSSSTVTKRQKKERATYTASGKTTDRTYSANSSSDSESGGESYYTEAKSSRYEVLQNIYYKGKEDKFYVKQENVPQASFTLNISLFTPKGKRFAAKITFNESQMKAFGKPIHQIEKMALSHLEHVKPKRYRKRGTRN